MKRVMIPPAITASYDSFFLMMTKGRSVDSGIFVMCQTIYFCIAQLPHLQRVL